MQLTPSERDRLLLFTVAELARARRARGLRLNVPEATALIADSVAEAARDGKRHDEALVIGQSVLGPDDVLPGVADVLIDVKVEALFGTEAYLGTALPPGAQVVAFGAEFLRDGAPVTLAAQEGKARPVATSIVSTP